MATNPKSRLAPGTTLPDYSTPSRILAAFGGDMSKVRAEYSRQRSIVRKRLDRMEAAGETYNKFYEYYKDRNNMIPSARSLSDHDLMDAMRRTAMALSGGFKGTVTEVKESRENVVDDMIAEAEEAEDYEFAEMLRGPVSSKQLAQMGSVMGMIQRVIGRTYSSDELRQTALKYVLQNPNESLLSKASRIMIDLGYGEDDGTSLQKLEQLKAMHTEDGHFTVQYKQSRRKRGM